MLLPDEKVKLLSMMEVLESLSQEDLRELSRRIPDTHVEKGRIFYTPEEKSEKLFMLKDGRVRLYTVAPDGRELTLTIVDSGQVFGEMSLTSQRLRGAYAEAMEPVVVCAMNRDQLEELVRDKPEVGIKLISILSERLTLYESRMEDIGLKEVPARLASLILRLIDSEGVMTRTGIKIPNRYTHEQLAAMVGAKRETVTRAFGQLQELGAVEFKRRKIHIRDMECLERTAALGVPTKVV
ncbi:MAG: Crp/Fnr family transcriptional regulator [Rubrobacteraceae bacterium]